MSIYEIDAKVKELKELRDMEAEVKSSIAAIEDSLKAEMLAKDAEAGAPAAETCCQAEAAE